jgi:hypothetical protein
MMNQYATNNNFSRSKEHDAECSIAYQAGYNHGLKGNKGLPRTMLLEGGVFVSRNSCCSAGVDLRLGHRAGLNVFLSGN